MSKTIFAEDGRVLSDAEMAAIFERRSNIANYPHLRVVQAQEKDFKSIEKMSKNGGHTIGRKISIKMLRDFFDKARGEDAPRHDQRILKCDDVVVAFIRANHRIDDGFTNITHLFSKFCTAVGDEVLPEAILERHVADRASEFGVRKLQANLRSSLDEGRAYWKKIEGMGYNQTASFMEDHLDKPSVLISTFQRMLVQR